jgi:hypothetical protein
MLLGIEVIKNEPCLLIIIYVVTYILLYLLECILLYYILLGVEVIKNEPCSHPQP